MDGKLCCYLNDLRIQTTMLLPGRDFDRDRDGREAMPLPECSQKTKMLVRSFATALAAARSMQSRNEQSSDPNRVDIAKVPPQDAMYGKPQDFTYHSRHVASAKVYCSHT